MKRQEIVGRRKVRHRVSGEYGVKMAGLEKREWGEALLSMDREDQS